MPVLRTDIERALDELATQEEGMRFQGLAVVLGKKLWPQLIARQRKKDFGLDAYAPPDLTPEGIGKGLAASITPTLNKISGDAKTAKENYPDLKALLFVTPAKVGNADRKRWEEAIQTDHNLTLHIIEREEIITQMMIPENASLCASFLHLDVPTEPPVAELIARIRRAADAVTRTWAAKTKGHPLIDLTAGRLDPNGTESPDRLSLEQIDDALLQNRRIVLEGSAGRGKTTTLIQIAQRARIAGTPFIVDLPAWTSSRKGILEFIAGMPAFQAEGLTATDLARAQQTEPFLFLLNGWNEISELNSVQSSDALRELERNFMSAGIIVATRTHHLTPPLPGAMRLRLSGLLRVQRTDYLAARLGAKGAELRARIDADPSLDELTRTPFILSEVASLFEAGAEIPSTKSGILAQVLHLQEQRDEHRNALQTAPLFGEQTEYLKALATEMTRRGTVTLVEADARAVVGAVTQELATHHRVEPVGAQAVLGALTAHHVLVRVDYPQEAVQFEHQQLQEHYAALDVHTRLLALRCEDRDETSRFAAEYVNDPAWAEPLRMIAQTFAEQTGDGEMDRRNTRAGGTIVEMALAIDPVFAGELVTLCGTAIWNEVRAAVGKRLRTLYTIHDGSFRQYAVAAMLATGSDDFADIIVPLLSGQDRHTRLFTYRLWPDFQVSSLGSNWRERVFGWNEEARVDFVSELLHHRGDDEIADFAAQDRSVAVKKAAVSALMWTGADEALTRVLDSMDAQTFEEVARQYADRMPEALRPQTIAAMRKFVERSTDHLARLQTALELIDFGETRLENIIKEVMAALSGGDTHRLSSRFIQPALAHLRKTDPAWVSEWVAVQIAEGVLYEHDVWLPFATAIPNGLVEKYLQRLETEDLRNVRFGGMVSVVAARAEINLAARVFMTLRDLWHKVEAEHSGRHELEWQVMRQMEDLFRHLPDDIAAAGILSAVTPGDPLDIKITASLLSRVARSDVEPLRIEDDDLKARLRTYLKKSVDVILRQNDFSGQEKANLASSIAQVGEPEDMADLVRLVRADIERVRRGRAARAAGDRGPLGNGGAMSYAGWHIAAIMRLDAASAVQVLIDLLSEPEYRSEAAAAVARDFTPKSEGPFDRGFRHDLVWAAREGRIPRLVDDQRRAQFATALNAEIKRLREQSQDGQPVVGLKELARALAAVDGRGSAPVVLDVIAMPGQRDQHICLEAAECLLMAGVILPANITFALVDSILERTAKWMQDWDLHLLTRILALCPFVDDPVVGIAKVREVLSKQRLQGHVLREFVTALGESRAEAAVDLLCELASHAPTFDQCEDSFINALAKLGTAHADELLLGFVDPDIPSIAPAHRLQHEHALIARLAELHQRNPKVAARLQSLCERNLPEPNRRVLSEVMDRIGTPEALTANLNLMDDARPSPVLQGTRDQLEATFVERRPYGENPNFFTQHARASNEMRIRLFRMALEDAKRRKSALALLGQIEEWRLEYGRPTDEPRHPDLQSGKYWPPIGP